MTPTASRGADSTPPTELTFTSRGVAVSPWIASLPCCCRGLLVWVYCETLRPCDTFTDRLRKVVLSGAFCGTSISVVSTCVEVASGSTDVTTTIGALSVADSMFLAASWMTLYMYTRCTGNASAVVMDLFFAATHVAWTLAVVSSTEFPLGVAVTLMLVLVQLSRTPRQPLHVVVLSALYLVSAWNHAAFNRSIDDVDHRLLGLSDIAVGDGRSRFFGSITALIGCLLVLMIVRAQVNEADRQVRETAAHADLAIGVATLLGDFDTAQAKADIDAAEARHLDQEPLVAIRRYEERRLGDAGVSSSHDGDERALANAAGSLYHTFRVLVQNLEAYRPHLPNWLVNRRIAGDDGAEDDVTVNGLHRPPTMLSNSTTTARTEETDSTAAMRKGGSVRRRGSSVGSGSSGKYSVRATLTRVWLHPAAMTKLAIAMAHVHFRVATKAEFQGWGAPSSSEAMEERRLHSRAPEKHRKMRHASTLSTFVDIVTDAASSVGAALHTLIGDVAIVSCNAAARAVHPELKMARFAVRLQDAVADHNNRAGQQLLPMAATRGDLGSVEDAAARRQQLESTLPIVIGGAIGAGKAEVTLAGSADKAQHVLIDGTKWLPVMRRHAALAADSGLLVADQRVANGLEFFVSTMPLGAVDAGGEGPAANRPRSHQGKPRGPAINEASAPASAEPKADVPLLLPLRADDGHSAAAEEPAAAAAPVSKVCLYALLTEIEASAADGDAWFLAQLDPNATGDDAALAQAEPGAPRVMAIANASGLPASVVEAALEAAQRAGGRGGPSRTVSESDRDEQPSSTADGTTTRRSTIFAECSELLASPAGKRTRAGRLAQMMLRLSE